MLLIKQLKNTKILLLFTLYFIAHVFLLMNFNGVYWDDWVVVYQKPETIINIFTQNGFIWIGYLHVFLQKLGNGIHVYRIFSFFAYFFSGVFIFYILQRIKYFDKSAAFFISLLFLLSPVNDARVALINTPPILNLFFFYFSFFLLSVYLDGKKKLYTRLFTLTLFFISFSLESLLVFYSTVLFYIFYNIQQKNQEKGFRLLILNFLIHYIDFICLPVLFFVLKNSFFEPHGLYANYNSLNSDPITLMALLIKSFDTALYQPIYHAFSTAWSNLGIILVVSIIVIYLMQKIHIPLTKDVLMNLKWNIKIHKRTFHIPGSLMMLTIGVILFLLAVFPYCVVGKLPQADNWAARNQILVPLGMSFIIYYLISFTVKIHNRIPNMLLYGVISIFIVQGLHSYYLYYIDWFYQSSLLEQFKHSKTIQEHTTFIVKDNLEADIWVNKRGFSFYEANGLARRAFNDDSRLIVHDISSIESFKQYKQYPQYNFSHWVNHTPVFLEFSKNKNYQLTWNKQFWLFFYNAFNQDAFEKNVKDLIEITKPTPT